MDDGNSLSASLRTLISYNPRGEVIDAHEIDLHAYELQPGRGYRYEYDDLGNRQSASVSRLGVPLADWQAEAADSADTETYPATNELNQYESIARPNPLHKLVRGLAHPEAAVEVSLPPVTPGTPALTVLRHGPRQETFFSEAAVGLGAVPFWQRLRVKASRQGAGPNGGDLVVGREGWLFFPPATETLAYDEDGNLVADARWAYGWDAENRLIWMEEHVIPGNAPRPARQRLEFTYDAQSRRIVKQVLEKTSEPAPWSLRYHRLFLYDGWNMIAELEVPVDGSGAAPRLHRAHAWGYDLSGTLTGAGGVGGLLLSTHHTPLPGGGTQVQTLAPLYDLNGNAVGYADVASGAVTHRFEFDPFGAELALDTLLHDPNDPEPPAFRFSTKYTDGETGLVYYGYRYYIPALGRWPSRDPIDEEGGLNLYGLLKNDSINIIDVIGLVPFAKIGNGKTAHQVAIQAISEIAHLTAADNKERGGLILKCGSFYVHTPSTVGTDAEWDPNPLVNMYQNLEIRSLPELEWIINEEGLLDCECKIVADYHTHPPQGRDDSERHKQNFFSESDYIGMKAAGWHVYLGAPNGMVKVMNVDHDSYNIVTYPPNRLPAWRIVLNSPVVGNWK